MSLEEPSEEEGGLFDAARAALHVAKERTRAIQAQLHGSTGRLSEGQRRELQRQLERAAVAVRKAKEPLARLSAMAGGISWQFHICIEAWHVLLALEDSGVDIGDRGRALLKLLADRMPPDRLIEEP